MEINYLSIVNEDTKAYPARLASVVNLAGSPFNDQFNTKYNSCVKASVSFFLDVILKEKDENSIDAVVFATGEPCFQANAILPLCRELRKEGLKVKLNTTGFYPEELKTLLPYLNYVSLEVKTRLDEFHYSKVLGAMPFSSFYQRLIRTFSFLQSASVIREVKTPIIGGFNNKKSIVESIAREITQFADLYVLEQAQITTDYAKALGCYPCSRQELIELAAAARNHFPKVNMRALHSIEQELIRYK